jgi:Flp pilus assembly protein TadG
MPKIMTHIANRLRKHGDDRGSISLFVVVIVLGLMLMIGLVVDGGGKIRAIQRADSVAAEAARSGTQAIQAGTAIRGNGAQPDPAQAQQAAQTYLTAAGVPGTTTVSGNTLTVTTTITVDTIFLNLVGVNALTGEGHATATLSRGTDGVTP